MLTSLSIGNFKAFGETQTIPIRPLTLIFGANSSGKSSIIHSLLLANHALANGNFDVHQPRLAGESVDLGGFREFAHRHRVDHHCTLAFAIEHEPYRTRECFSSFRRTTVRLDLGLVVHDAPSKRQSNPPGLVRCVILADDCELLRTIVGEDGFHHVQNVNFDHPHFTPFFAQINRLRPAESPYRQPGPNWQPSSDVQHAIEDAKQIDDLCADATKPDAMLLELRETFHRRVDTMRRSVQVDCNRDASIRTDFFGELRMWLETGLEQVPLNPRNLIPVSARSSHDREAYSEEAEFGDQWRGLEALDNLEFFDAIEAIICFEIEELLDWVNQTVSRPIESATYLGPLRSYPPRHLIGMHDKEPNWFSGGGHAWDILRRDPDVAARVNDWFEIVGAGCRLTVRNLTDISRLADPEKQALAKHLQTAIGADEAAVMSALEGLLRALTASPTASLGGEVALLDKSTGTEVTHRDVGIGISQVLPVLVHAIADRKQIVAIEQPEIHLHPALQAELGDVFIESALGERKNTFLLETHSEHLILRILRRIRETTADGKPGKEGLPPIRPEDVSVVYVQPGPRGAEVIELPVTPDGDFSRPWPKGFFSERALELF
jgi:hypothetical protein